MSLDIKGNYFVDLYKKAIDESRIQACTGFELFAEKFLLPNQKFETDVDHNFRIDGYRIFNSISRFKELERFLSRISSYKAINWTLETQTARTLTNASAWYSPYERTSCHIFAKPACATFSTRLRGIPGLTCVFKTSTQLPKSFSNPYGEPGSRPQHEQYAVVQNGNFVIAMNPVHIYDGIPSTVRDILPPFHLDLPIETYPTAYVTDFVYPKVPGVAKEIDSMNVMFSTSLMAPVSFFDIGTLKLGEKPAIQARLGETIHAIKVHKIKNEFKLVEITLDTYLKDPQHYIVVLGVAKKVGWHSSNGNGRDSLKVVIETSIPTLIIPPSLLYSNSPRVTETIIEFLKNFNNQSMERLFNKEEFAGMVAEHPELTKYWSGALDVLGTCSRADLRTTLEEYGTLKPQDPSHKLANVAAHSVLGSAKYYKLKNNEDQLKAAKNSKTSMDQNMLHLNDNMRRCQSSIQNHKNHIVTLEANVQEDREQLSIIEKERQDLYKTLQTLADKTRLLVHEFVEFCSKPEDIKIEEEKFSKEVLLDMIIVASTRSNTSYTIKLKNTESAHVFMNNHSLTPETVNELLNDYEYDMAVQDVIRTLVSKKPTDPLFYYVVTQLLAFESIRLLTIQLSTEKPVKIYVDNNTKPKEQCEVVIGGPYKAVITATHKTNGEVNKVNGHVFMAGPDGVFGCKPVDNNLVKLKAHPHSEPRQVVKGDIASFVEFLSGPTKMCQGEGEIALAKAIQNKNIETVRGLITAWITSCWSKDDWGRDFGWFPTAAQVDLDGKYNEKVSKNEPSEA